MILIRSDSSPRSWRDLGESAYIGAAPPGVCRMSRPPLWLRGSLALPLSMRESSLGVAAADFGFRVPGALWDGTAERRQSGGATVGGPSYIRSMDIRDSLRRMRLREQEMEHAVMRTLQTTPLFALEIASSLGEDQREVAEAVTRCHSGGLILLIKRDGPFSLA
jgi:hypothetical protein